MMENQSLALILLALGFLALRWFFLFLTQDERKNKHYDELLKNKIEMETINISKIQQLEKKLIMESENNSIKQFTFNQEDINNVSLLVTELSSSTLFHGYVRFKNGNCTAEQKFEAESMAKLSYVVNDFISSLDK